MAISGISNHARDNEERPFLTKREVERAMADGMIIKIPAKGGRVAFCHTGKKIAVIADANLTTIITYSPGGHFFRIIDTVEEAIKAGRVKKREETNQELFLLLNDGTKVFMNKRGTRIRRIFPSSKQ